MKARRGSSQEVEGKVKEIEVKRGIRNDVKESNIRDIENDRDTKGADSDIRMGKRFWVAYKETEI